MITGFVPVWSFGTDGEQVSGARPEVGEWLYVLGVYDAETGKAHLYVNGEETGAPAEVAPSTAPGTSRSAGHAARPGTGTAGRARSVTSVRTTGSSCPRRLRSSPCVPRRSALTGPWRARPTDSAPMSTVGSR
ncbi:LamG-like jellyroll fold domain-containing protein [Streptomyces sp. NPDC019224]|uniref:LamG-like jellyroll fold domain-containing protein n=1 Tax=Streptomyces sp. NPDC019224 TaxID=3154484 RepID=UPI0033F8D39F